MLKWHNEDWVVDGTNNFSKSKIFGAFEKRTPGARSSEVLITIRARSYILRSESIE